MELVTKEFVLSFNKNLGWNIYYSVAIPSAIKLSNINDRFYNEMYFYYKDSIPIVYLISLEILIVPKPLELSTEDLNTISEGEGITVDSWSLILKEEGNKSSITMNRLMLTPNMSFINRDSSLIPGKYEISSSLCTEFKTELDIIKRTGEHIYWKYFLVGNECLNSSIYPLNKNTYYLYSIFYFVIYLKFINNHGIS